MVSLFGRHSRPLFALLLLFAFGRDLSAGKEFTAGPRDQVVANQLLVGLKLGADITQVLSAIVPQAVVKSLGSNRNVFQLQLPPGIAAAVSKLLAAHPLVNYVEPNRIRSTTILPPNDTYFTQQWNLVTVGALGAWSYFPDQYLTAGTAGVNRTKVAILDTGADCTHPDFMNAGGTSTDSASGGQFLWSASVAIQTTTISNPACEWEDDYGHGTHVAGILAAATDNGTGVASLGFPLQLIIIKTSGASGSATDFQVAEGIYDAIEAGASVISMSLGGDGYSQTLQTALDTAWENNVLVVAAAGNTGNSALVYPGAGNHALGVGATDNTNTVASFSTYGNWVKIAAPGVNIYSTLPTYSGPDLCCTYGALSGTSMATPHVSALAGLLYAANPGISAAEVAQRIQQTAQSTHSGWNEYIGYGVINAAAALGGIPGPFTQGALTGQVIGPASAGPLTGAVVTAGTQSYTTALDAITGDLNGLFRINLSPGTYPVTVTYSGYTTVNTQATVVAGADTMLTVQMGVALGELTGTVTYNSAGVAGAVVDAVSTTTGLIVGTAITNSFGGYTLSVSPDTYTLTASAPDYISATSASQVLGSGATITANLSLTTMGDITGAVTDANGVPVANAHIDFASGSFSGGATTGSNGTYTTMGLPVGTYTVTASASGYSNVSESGVSVVADSSTPVNLQFSTGIALGNGLLGYWPFNEGSGSVAHDLSGNNYNATLTGATWSTGFQFPYALTFSGSGSNATTPAIPFSGPFSAAVWVNSAATEGSWAALAETPANSAWYLGTDQTDTKYKLIVNNGKGSTGDCSLNSVVYGCAQGAAISTGWHLVAGTYDGTTGILYVDGAMVASDTFTGIGGSVALEFGLNWAGTMQSTRVYGRALTASEVATLYSEGTAAALSLSKTADAATVSAGSSIGYTLTAGNIGGGSASAAGLSDPLPTGTGIDWAISPAYSGPGSCSIASGTLSCSFGSLAPGASASVHVTTATTAGSCGVYANTATVSASNATSVQASATITVQCSQTIAFAGLPNEPFGTAPFPVSASATSQLAVSFNSQTMPVCTVSGSTVALLAGGLCTIQATQAGNSVYTAATPVNQSFQVTPGSQTISFGALSSEPFGTAAFPVSASTTSQLAVSFNSQTMSVCTVAASTVTLLAVGTCTIQATQAGNTNWAAATPVNQGFQVTPGSQTISFGSLPSEPFGTAAFPVSASSTSQLAVSFNSQTMSVCTVTASTVTLLAVGTCTIQATQPGNTNWAAATPVNQSFQVTPGSQTISFGSLPSEPFGTAAFPVSASSTSQLAVSFNSQTMSVCTVTASTVTLLAVGTCTIQATQAGTANWAAATSVNQSFQVTPGSQTISFGTLSSRVFGSGTFTVGASATSQLAVSFNSQTMSVCTVAASTVTLAAVGTCTIQATQAGTANWAAATSVNQSFQVTPGSQTISFGTLSSRVFGSGTFTVGASATSQLAVSFNSQTMSVCTVAASTVTLAAVGTCTIQATQAGTANWAAASSVNQSFQVTQGTQTITFITIPSQSLGTAPFALNATASSGLTVTLTSQTTSVCTVQNGAVTLAAIGNCTIQAAQAGNSNYSGATPVTQSFTVTGAIGTSGVNSLSFPNTIVGKASATQTFNFQNSGNTPLTIAAIARAGPDGPNYQYIADALHPCPISPATLASGASCTLDVTFVPLTQGTHSNAQISVTDNSGNVSGNVQAIGLAGTGIALTTITIGATNASLAYGASEQFIATGTYSDNSTATLTSQVTWASSAQSVAGIGTGGLATTQSAGQTNITGALSGVTSNTFQLTVTAGAPASIAAAAGSGQSAEVGAAFSAAFQALVKDGAGDGVPNTQVTFTAAMSGASGTFSNGLATYAATTNASGIATALAFTANSTGGSYSVTASAAGVSNTASFSLTNVKNAVLTITESAVGTFIQGQSASYTITVSNAANAGPTSGTVTVTEMPPAGLTLTGLNGGSTWICNVATATCTTNTVLNPGAQSPIAATVAVAYNAQASVSNGVSVTGGGSQPASNSAPTAILSACAVTLDSGPTVADIQQMINEALGIAPPVNDLNADGMVNTVDLEIVGNAVLGTACKAS